MKNWLSYLILLLIIGFMLLEVYTAREIRREVEKIQGFQETLELMKEESGDCLIYALKTIEEVRRIVEDAFKDKLLFPTTSKNWFIVMDTSKEEEKGLEVEFRK